MHRQWIINVDRSKGIISINDLESKYGNVCLIGRPLAEDLCSVAELEVMNLIGIYMEMPDLDHNEDNDKLKNYGMSQDWVI